MKYVQSLKEKNLAIEQLSAGMKKNIEQLNQFHRDIEQIKTEAGDSPTEEQVKDIELMEKNFSILDEKVNQAVIKFDLAQYQERVKTMKELSQRKTDKANRAAGRPTKPKDENAPETKVVQMPAPQNSGTGTTNGATSVPLSGTTHAVINATPVDKVVEQAAPVIEQAQVNADEVQSNEEFELVQKVQKKSNGAYITCIGIGALLLTFGAVNLFKQNR